MRNEGIIYYENSDDASIYLKIPASTGRMLHEESKVTGLSHAEVLSIAVNLFRLSHRINNGTEKDVRRIQKEFGNDGKVGGIVGGVVEKMQCEAQKRQIAAYRRIGENDRTK